MHPNGAHLARVDRTLSQFHVAVDELAFLNRELSQLVALLDRDQVLARTVRLLTEDFGFHCAWVAERDGVEGVVIGHTSGNRTDRFHGLTLRNGCGLGGKVFAFGGVEWVNDYLASPEITHDYDGEVADESIQCMIAAPIGSGAQPVGVLLGGLRADGSFGGRAAAIVETVAERTAQALVAAERARQAAEAAVYEERQRLALDLHDTVGAMLFAITAGVRGVSGDTVDEAVRARLAAIERQASDAASTLRDALRAMRSPADQLMLAAALEAACVRFEERTRIGTKLIVLDVLPALEAKRGKALVAAAKEGLLNVEKHASATKVVVTLASMHEGAAVTVRDDGVGLQVGDGQGFGLEAVSDMLFQVGGRLQVSQDGDGGVSFRAWVPY
ncbi:MAG: two-component system sensor kinase [Candidatus Eremiobacteraeota bacterium]|nr:two-component system sensor kinase [Candidatus Eremiobacteraeota bacterium]